MLLSTSIRPVEAGGSVEFAENSARVWAATIRWMSPQTVRLYSRRTCELCDRARAAILAEQARGTNFLFDEVFIDGDPGLEGAYGLRVPVVEIDGVEEFEVAVEPGRFRRLVAP
jgi:hypothetical protein